MRNLAYFILATQVLALYLIHTEELPPFISEDNVDTIMDITPFAVAYLALKVAKVI